MWMDESVTADDENAMNSSYKGKVSITFSHLKTPEYLVNTFSDIKRLAIEDENIAGGSGIVKVSHEDAEIEDAGYESYGLDPEEVIANLKQEEYRYYGSNPNNYVKFNNELWRIIGLVNTPEGQRVKIIRATPLEPAMSYDNKNNNEGTSKGPYGSNDWSDAKLQLLLNSGAYYNRTSGECPTGQNNESTPCDFSNNGLTDNAKEMIDTIIWNLGGNSTSIGIITSNYYNYERGTTVSSSRPKLWQGKIALMYPSDYGYATSGESTNNRELCLKQELSNWKNDTYQSDCAYNNWLLETTADQRMLMPITDYWDNITAMGPTGGVGNHQVWNPDLIKPTLYLKPEVLIASGKGTEEEPYELSYHEYKESILNGTDPVLKDKLIPVIINNDGSVIRADLANKWYSYKNQEWANAVILVDGVKDPGAGNKIEEKDIESYFVWIPRYRYRIFSDTRYDSLSTEIEDRVQTIEVVFENKETEKSTGDKKNEWLTHPAFTAFNTNGIWVGKFETGYKDADSTSAAQVNPDSEQAAISAASKVIIKPNVYSWRSIQVAKAYVVGRNYEANLNSHMMKNTEWGAVAYLQQSVYGSRQEVMINNNASYLTGYAAKNAPTTGNTGTNEPCTIYPKACNEYGGATKGSDGEVNVNYFNSASVVASTTNNYSGIFDMSGGTFEYMMAGMDDGPESTTLSSGRNNIYNSGFNGKLTCPSCTDTSISPNKDITEVTGGIDLPNDKRYYDIYSYIDSGNDYTRTILGDATGEMGPFRIASYIGTNPSVGKQYRIVGSWYDDDGYPVIASDPWVVRGGAYYFGTAAGIFNFSTAYGSIYGNIGFRLVLAF